MKQRYFRHVFTWILFSTAVILLFTTLFLQLTSTRDIRILKGETFYVNFRLPFLYVRGDCDDIILFNGGPLPGEPSRVESPLNLEALELGQVNLQFFLFGRIPLHQITVNVLPEIYLVPGGHSIGIKLHSEGVTVVGYYYFESSGRSISPARESGIHIGDTILEINGKKAADVNRAARLLEEAGSEPLLLLISRNGDRVTVSLDPVYSDADGDYRIGLYIRDSAAGVGTLSFYDPESKRYGALGHIILDSDTNKPINLDEGTVVKAKIVDIKLAQRGQPGEKTGIFIEDNSFKGNIEKNTPFGIFGEIKNIEHEASPYPAPIPMALATQVETGPAEILTVVEGETIGRYLAEIERITYQPRASDKGMVIRIVDEELLERTGGIVQGMSGSPIIQNGKLAGAVTHVFVNDPTRGYGIFMEWMHQEAVILTNN